MMHSCAILFMSCTLTNFIFEMNIQFTKQKKSQGARYFVNGGWCIILSFIKKCWSKNLKNWQQWIYMSSLCFINCKARYRLFLILKFKQRFSLNTLWSDLVYMHRNITKYLGNSNRLINLLICQMTQCFPYLIKHLKNLSKFSPPKISN